MLKVGKMIKEKYRGVTKSGEAIYGSLVETTHFLNDKPKQHTKTWIVQTSFGNGGWFMVQKRQYVLPGSVSKFTTLYDYGGNELYTNDIIMYDGEEYVIEFVKGCYGISTKNGFVGLGTIASSYEINKTAKCNKIK